jgi:acetylornithine deacetylase/succinyl-diaminopimelate desuccinylase-like protein
MTAEDMKRVHGINERIKITDYEQQIKFYIQLIKNINK